MIGPLELAPGRSRTALLLRLSVLAVLLIGTGLLWLPPGWRLGLGLAILLEVGVVLSRARSGGALSVEGGRWWWRDGGEMVPVGDCRVTFLSASLVVLTFGRGLRRRSVPVFADGLAPERFRALLVAARTGTLP
jgi:hypothetical protein